MSKFLNQGSKLQKFTCIDEIISSITEQQKKSNENIIDFRLKKRFPVRIRCFKLNPPFIDKSVRFTEREKLPKVKVLKVPNIKSYYNLQLDENFSLKTSLIADTSELFELIDNKIKIFEEDPTYRNKDEKIVTKKFLRIKKNCGNKEKFLDKIIDKFVNYKSDQLLLNHNKNDKIIQTNNEENLTNPTHIDFCNDLCNHCTKKVNFRTNQIQQLNKISVLKELKIHGHPTSRLMDNGKQRNLQESQNELMKHYLAKHSEIHSPSLPNTSKNL